MWKPNQTIQFCTTYTSSQLKTLKLKIFNIFFSFSFFLRISISFWTHWKRQNNIVYNGCYKFWYFIYIFGFVQFQFLYFSIIFFPSIFIIAWRSWSIRGYEDLIENKKKKYNEKKRNKIDTLNWISSWSAHTYMMLIKISLFIPYYLLCFKI